MAVERAPYRIYDPRRAIGRTGLSLTIGLIVAAALDLRFPLAVSLLGGWNATAMTLVALSWTRIASFDEQRTCERAAADDPGRTAVYALVVLTSLASLLAATVIVRHAEAMAASETGLMLALCLSTVALSWTVTHTAFTLRYAHLYYREDKEGVGGIDFPGGILPSYADFAYFAFTIGMCFQVSDAVVSNRQMRSTVLLHAVISFVYNTSILAFVLNLAFGRAG